MADDWDVDAVAAEVMKPKPSSDGPKAKGPSTINKLSGYLAAANRMTNPLSGVIRDVADTGMAKERMAAGLEGLRQRDTQSEDPEAQALNLAGRYGPGIAATAMFPPAGAADLAGIAALRYAPAVGVRGAQAARLAAAAGSAGTTAGLGTLAASAAAGDPALDESLQVGKEFATGEVAAPAIGAVAKPAWRGLKALGAGALERSGTLFSGVPTAAWETLDKAGEKVAGYARQGMTTDAENKPIARAMEQAKALTQAAKEKAQGYGLAAQEKIGQVAKGAGKKYEAMMSYLSEDMSGDKFSVAEKVYDRFEPYVKSQGVTLRKPVGEAETSASKAIMDIYGEIKSSLQEGMAPAEAAEHLQRLTSIQRNNPGKSVSAHAKELKNILMESLPGDYRFPTADTPTPRGWSIGDTRAEYRAAKETERGLKKFSGAENAPKAFASLENAGGKTARALRKALGPKGVPGFADDIAAMKGAEAAAQPEINAAKAGAAFAPKFTQNLPRTGLTAGVATSIAKVAGGDPLAIAVLPLELLGMSPRYAMETRLAAKKGSAALESYAAKNASKFPPIIANALKAARENKEKK